MTYRDTLILSEDGARAAAEVSDMEPVLDMEVMGAAGVIAISLPVFPEEPWALDIHMLMRLHVLDLTMKNHF
jgi:hypothetical protein